MKKVLVYDENTEDFERLRSAVPGNEYIIAQDKDKMWELVKNEDYHVILADLNMGMSIDARFLALLKAPPIDKPALIYTNVFGMPELKRSMNLRANNYILKSNPYNEIAEAIENAEFHEQYRNTYTLGSSLGYADMMRVKKDGEIAGCLGGQKVFKTIGNKPIKDWTEEDLFNITAAGEYTYEGTGSLKIIRRGERTKSTERNVILFVDDEELLRDMLSLDIEDLFREAGTDVEIVRAGSAEEAIDVYTANKNRIAMSIIDMRMPLFKADGGMVSNSAGVDVLRRIRFNEPQCECIILTGFSYSKELCECFRLGAYDLCDKERKDIFFGSVMEGFKQGQNNYREYEEASYVMQSYYRQSFAGALVTELLHLLGRTRELSFDDKLRIIEFEYMITKVL
ncbi:MAG: hypothetical protein DKM50_10675 [Candidatus Margulisiibacteriota bacterium]|nr:MAG: hypothetical protein A2X43_06930 [Candidatus Margulisbacteria bacterium GWD2_39_127]OGI02985.1 MAG: hypothetical protein A2X42_12905 [Candidatus Margulisbacteria bacterium GWF2_38_17]OGI11537.1 MAG: hypothetical protein A2X41_00250 [Candidatus Margulisbacteria bacterium GWE2_39_32]PZM78778.1 MAG: hypothetical protein DKM50_10675 [Candidatus Margulisiibacteriota bacterium]HAR63319.1 hypothetical protein [Candidatus Margulisiibacteriota bacterium]